MPQNPIAVGVVPNPALKTALNLSAAEVVKAAPGTIVRVIVTTAGSAPGSVNDVATDAPTAGNTVANIPNALGLVELNFPCKVGVLIVPGTGQVLSAVYQ